MKRVGRAKIGAGRTIRFFKTQQEFMAKKSLWADKVCALVMGGNTSAAMAQMRVAPDPQDLQRLRKLLIQSGLLERYPALALALNEHLALLSSPRLHRAP